ncbi:MAG TPA: bifunctional homocysteine S-methyltransferase/methylenetetrahydrofolate reductase [Anaerolineales bacterium]|nr:bifunctional homocysteine S-methyltransferase/methylenetetrahydrofolate reductase [Anaerolineales bacterium]
MALIDFTSSPLLADGAMGTMLHVHGIDFDSCFDELNLTRPEVVTEVHRAYLDAGAQIIETNTFGANRYKLVRHGLHTKVRQINAAAATLARQALSESGKNAYVAGSVGPLGVRLAPFGRVGHEQAYAAFHDQIAVLVASGVDIVIVETMTDLYETIQAVRAAKAVSKLPVVASMTFTRDDLTLLGDTPAHVAAELAAAGADIIGVNCSSGPAQVLRILESMKAAVPTVKFSVMPNAGWPERVGDRIMYPASPEYFGEYAAAFVAAGASIIGGCCGTTPGHIAAMRAALDDLPGRRPTPIAVDREPSPAEREAPIQSRTRLAEKFSAGEFVIGVEVHPPKGLTTQKLIAGASLLAEAGADVINVADSPMARMRMSAWAVCHLVQSRVKVESVLHFPTRGRNLLRLQGDLLAAHALGIRNIFVVMGDPTSVGDYPKANDNYDLVPSGLIQLIKQGFNAGVDHAGQDIGQPTSFYVGCALNPCAPDVDKEIKTLRKKILAGADFALTQPIFESGMAREFLRRYTDLYGPLTVPLLAGVLPLHNARHANFFHNEVPGVFIPDSVRDRMQKAGDGPEAIGEGMRLAGELLTELREANVAQGVYLMPPFGRYHIAAEIIDAVRMKT